MGDALAVVERARQLKDTLPGLKAEAVGVQRATGVVGERVMLVAARDIREGEVGCCEGGSHVPTPASAPGPTPAPSL